MNSSERAILHYTANMIHPGFAESIRRHLRSLIRSTDLMLISISQKPIDFGLNICVGEMGHSAWLVYWQILQGALAAREMGVEWLYCSEDDSLYNLEHLDYVPPRKDVFYYNLNRWIVETNGGQACFRWRDRISMVSCVVSADLMISTLEARFKKFPEPILRTYDPRLKGWGEPGRYEWYLKLPKVDFQFFETKDPILTFNHKKGLGGLRKQKVGDIIKDNLPPWGLAETIWERFYGN